MVADILDNWPVPASKFRSIRVREKRTLRAPFFVLVADQGTRRKGKKKEKEEGK